MHKVAKAIERFVRNPYVELIIGLIIMATGLAEAGDSIVEDISSGDVGAHHGIILLGVAHAFKAVPSILTGILLFANAEAENDAAGK